MIRPIVLALSSLSFIACGSIARQDVALSPCTVSAIEAPALCGTIDVPENRAKRGGRSIALHVTVVKASSGATEPDPLVFLAGGPGQAASEITQILAPELQGLMRTRDLVLLDQRGTGKSNPLTCAGAFELLEPHRASDLARCAAELQTRADVTQYTTDAAVEDLRHVLDRLGYRQVNLVAASYGTRPAFVFMRRYPERVRTSVLRAVAPPGFNIISGGSMNFARQMEQLVTDCAADEACARAFPRLGSDIVALQGRLRTAPVRVTATNPVTRTEETFDVTPALLQQTLYVMLLNPATRQMLPALLTDAAAGDFRRIAPLMLQVRTAVYGSLPVGLYLSVVCSEDAPRVTAADRAQILNAFGDLGVALVDACDAWSRGRVAPELLATTMIDVPVLLVSGAADPATPATSGADAAAQLRNVRHVIAPATAHVPMFPGCIRDIVEQFVVSGGTAAIDQTCVRELRWPPFVVPAR